MLVSGVQQSDSVIYIYLCVYIYMCQDFPGGPVVKTLPSSAGDAGSIPGWGAKLPHASGSKNQNIKRSNIVTNSIKTLKMVHIKKKSLKKCIYIYFSRFFSVIGYYKILNIVPCAI